MGSRVPQWPTFLLPNLRDIERVLPTTSNEVQSWGLSMRRTMFCHASTEGGGSGGLRKCGGGTGFLPDFGRGASASAAEAEARNAARRGTANVLRGTREETTSPTGARHARASVAARVDMRW